MDAALADGGAAAGGARPDLDAGRDGSADPCALAVDGAPCAVEGTSCGGPCTDPCSFCNVIGCTQGVWRRVEVFPAPCFDCGPTLRCMLRATYCDVARSDVGGIPDSYSCPSMPAACRDDATCACVTSQVASDACDQVAGTAEITVEHFGG